MRTLLGVLFLVLLLVAHGSAGSEWEPMRILIVNKYSPFPPNLLSSMTSALKWFESAIQVPQITAPLTRDEVVSRIPEYADDDVTLLTSAYATGPTNFMHPNMEKVLNHVHLAVFVLNEDVKICEEDPLLMASVEPVSSRAELRPKMAVMRFCERDVVDDDDFNHYDLFRHEILHGLGYGTIEPVAQRRRAPPSEKYTWRSERSIEQTAIRQFMHFGEKAVESVKEHFECDSDDVHGVESDELRNHLNEYIFGNELMTPVLDMPANYFSHISADIIEATYNGDSQWYQVNRTHIAPEHALYRRHKGFGCTFLLKSCYEFISEHENTDKDILPFCKDKSECFYWLGGKDRLAVTCDTSNSRTDETADNGIKQPQFARSDNPEYRFCPTMPNFGKVPQDYTLGPCRPS